MRAQVESPDAGELPPWMVPGSGVQITSPSPGQPGVLGLTTHEARSDGEVDAVRAMAPALAVQMRETPGFLGAILVIFGHRMFSLSAWSDYDGPRRINRGGVHRDAIEQVMEGDLTAGGLHSLWTADSVRFLARCESCGTVTDSLRAHGRCGQCGEGLWAAVRYL
jgi:hypothetical protein